MKSLTIAYLTSRKEPKTEWFFDSLHRQGGDECKIIVVNLYLDKSYNVSKKLYDGTVIDFLNVPPKPTIWQGPHRITKEDWWAKSNAHNTAICLCKTEWIAFVDDRCVLTSQWLNCVKNAMEGDYAVCGSYEKNANMQVRDGVVTDYGEDLGIDTRTPGLYEFGSWYGGSCALPLEWCLQVNGYPEDMCDGLGSEDSMFGVILRNSGYSVRYDSTMRIIEDRTPGIAYEGALKRSDKNSHLGRQAKSWAIVRAFGGKSTSGNHFDIRDMRARKLKGEDWRPPQANHFDWYDGQPISEME